MRLAEALRITKSCPANGQPHRVSLACGFEPLHLRTFLTAHLQTILPGRKVEVECGRYGDLLGNIRSENARDLDAVVAIIEWPDLDPRLGVRQLGGWTPAAEGDIVCEARKRLDAVATALERAAPELPIACALPSLPLVPFAHRPPCHASSAELSLHEAVNSFAYRVRDRVRFLSRHVLDHESPPGSRYDVRSELSFGFPYQLSHADRVSALLATLIAPTPPKKALITDLDDCLWSGIIGEVGVEGVHWDLDHHSQIHGLYQQLLGSLAAAGVLIGVASRNDAGLVERALGRTDLLLARPSIFPVEAHWGPKSESVDRIVREWNIGFDSVVFVDDSPMEVAEVAATFPEVECILFPASDPAAAYSVLGRLRTLFGKQRIVDDDLIRAVSLRRRVSSTVSGGATHDTNAGFLQQADAELTFTQLRPPVDPRALELVNKTNQFNLNGRRHQDADWSRRVSNKAGVHMLAAYRDKFGPLGKIAVLSGHVRDRVLFVDIWVMSCRAFGRHIEHALLHHLFDRYNIDEIRFDFVVTDRNGRLGDLLRFYLGDLPHGAVHLSRRLFVTKCPPLFHRAKETLDE